MKSTRLICVVLSLAFLIGNSAATETWVLRFDGVGPVKIGMSLSQLNAVLQRKSEPDDEGGCFYVESSKHPHLKFMIIEGRLARIDVEEPGAATSTGMQVGDSDSRVKQVYGARVKVTPHQYIDSGHYLTVRSSDGHYGVRFETDQGKITSFYAGRYEAIQYVEGCL
jgi:hypothetical protein